MRKYRVLLVGFGNELVPQDSCAKPVVEQLGRECWDVEARWLGRGVQALLWLATGYDKVVAVDASRRLAPGEVKVTKVTRTLCSMGVPPQSLHEQNITDVLCTLIDILEALGRNTEVFIIEYGLGRCSDTLLANLTRVVRGVVGCTR